MGPKQDKTRTKNQNKIQKKTQSNSPNTNND